jgi:threonyl-tRNA synthetase
LWLAPVQAVVIPIGSAHHAYAKQVAKKLALHDIRYEVWDDNETIGKKIREGELQKIPYLLVVGDKERRKNAVSVRQRGKGDIGMRGLDNFIKTAITLVSKKYR